MYKRQYVRLKLIEEGVYHFGVVSKLAAKTAIDSGFDLEIIEQFGQMCIRDRYTTLEVIEKASEYVDLFLFDIKQIDSDKHFHWTGVRNERILENLKYLLENRANVEIRVPLIKDVNTDLKDIESLIKFLLPYKDYKNLKGVDLLPYHKMGVNKYEQLGMDYEMKGEFQLTNDELDQIENLIKKYDLHARVIRH